MLYILDIEECAVRAFPEITSLFRSTLTGHIPDLKVTLMKTDSHATLSSCLGSVLQESKADCTMLPFLSAIISEQETRGTARVSGHPG